MDAPQSLFDNLPDQIGPARPHPQISEKIWTEHKAQLIARYLKQFVLITKHGAYIDGFAGPKSFGKPNTWAADLVLANEPRWLRNFFLCDNDAQKVKHLEALVSGQPLVKSRKIQVLAGDFNERIDEILASGQIKPKTASFCLIDQYTSECHWDTVRKIALHKPEGSRKIEQFYFLATGWLPRSISQTTVNTIKPEMWWGRPDWRDLIGLKPNGLVLPFIDRFEKELGYRYVTAWPIMEKINGGGRTMFFMIHASDHDQAPALMKRAYEEIVLPPPDEEQLDIQGL